MLLFKTCLPFWGCEPGTAALGSDGACASRVGGPARLSPTAHTYPLQPAREAVSACPVAPILKPKWDISWLLKPSLVISSLLTFSRSLSCLLTCGPRGQEPHPAGGRPSHLPLCLPEPSAQLDVLRNVISSPTPVRLTLSQLENLSSCSVSGMAATFKHSRRGPGDLPATPKLCSWQTKLGCVCIS